MTLPIEERYAAPGPRPVATDRITEPDGRVLHRILHPADLPDVAVAHALVTWANGSHAAPSNYRGLLRHLASWGFVVVASTSPRTGTGREVLAGARFMVEMGHDPRSPYHGCIDVGAVAAVGHSQGAGGAVRATLASAGLIATTVSIDLPAPLWVRRRDRFDLRRIDVPILLLGGSLDLIAAPPWALRGHFARVPGPAALAVRRGAGHLAPGGTGDGYLGYVTAWLRYRLTGDDDAAPAFAGPDPEVCRNPDWAHQATKDLDHPAARDPGPGHRHGGGPV